VVTTGWRTSRPRRRRGRPTAAIWRPLLNQNIVLRLSGAVLLPGDGFKELFGAEDNDDFFYSILGNIVLTY